MNAQKQVEEYIASQPEPRRSEMQALHDSILQISPGCKLWFLDGKDAKGKVVSNPNIGYGNYTMRLATGKTREFYQIGLAAVSSGISVYIMGIEDRKYLAETYGKDLGPGNVTCYCIRFAGSKKYKHRRPQSGDRVWVREYE